MKILSLLIEIHNFFSNSRRSGTSSLIKRVANKNDVCVLVPHGEEEQEFRGGVSIHKAITEKLATQGKPILVDNHTMLYLTTKAIEGIEDEIEKHEKTKLAIEAATLILKDGLTPSTMSNISKLYYARQRTSI